MALLKQSTAYVRSFLMVLSSDSKTGATGKTVTVNLSKAGAGFGVAGGAVAEIANGWYKVSLNTTDTGTVGDLAYDCTASGCDNTDFCDQVGLLDIGGGVIPTVTNLTNPPTAGDLTSTMKTSVENAVWDAARSSHVATGSLGQLGLGILRDNTATAGAASTITLDAGASTTVDIFKGDVVAIYSGTGAGQVRVISTYSAGRVATVVPAWVTTPDNTSKFIILAQRTPLVGTDSRILTSADVSTSGETGVDTSGTTTLLSRVSATRAGNLDNLDTTVSGQGNPTGAVATGTNSATTFKTNRSETTDDYWKDVLVVLTSGAMIGQIKKVSSYNGTTKEVTLTTPFTGTPADGVTFLFVNR